LENSSHTGAKRSLKIPKKCAGKRKKKGDIFFNQAAAASSSKSRNSKWIMASIKSSDYNTCIIAGVLQRNGFWHTLRNTPQCRRTRLLLNGDNLLGPDSTDDNELAANGRVTLGTDGHVEPVHAVVYSYTRTTRNNFYNSLSDSV